MSFKSFKSLCLKLTSFNLLALSLSVFRVHSRRTSIETALVWKITEVDQKRSRKRAQTSLILSACESRRLFRFKSHIFTVLCPFLVTVQRSGINNYEGCKLPRYGRMFYTILLMQCVVILKILPCFAKMRTELELKFYAASTSMKYHFGLVEYRLYTKIISFKYERP